MSTALFKCMEKMKNIACRALSWCVLKHALIVSKCMMAMIKIKSLTYIFKCTKFYEVLYNLSSVTAGIECTGFSELKGSALIITPPQYVVAELFFCFLN